MTKYEDFVKAYSEVQKAARFASGEDKGANANIAIREYAVKFAKDVLGIPMSDPVAVAQIKNSPNTIDTYLRNANEYYRANADGVFDSNTEEIIRSAPEKGLVKILNQISPVELAGNERHNKKAELQAKYQALKGLLGQYKDEKIDHSEFLKAAGGVVIEYVEQKLQKNAILKDDENIRKLAMSSVLETLAVSDKIAQMVVAEVAKDSEKKFNDEFKSDKDKVKYVIETITELAKDKKTVDMAKSYLLAAK
jgi:peptidoglycan hydrolase-like protein with peptidoglycan-binding domain